MPPLSKNERSRLIRTIRKLVPLKHINVANPHQDYAAWIGLVDERTPKLIDTDQVEFETGVRELLAALGSSHTAFFHESGYDVPAPHAINATLRAADTRFGKRWMFLDVIEDGPAYRAGIRPGDLLLTAEAAPLIPPAQPRFRIGGVHHLQLASPNGNSPREITIEVPNRAAKDRPPMIEPRSVSHRMLDADIGYLRVATFPGAVGLDFAKSLGMAVGDLTQAGCQRLIIDLRGNIGGGLGSLRLMSYLSPEKLPVGHSLTRRRLQNGYDREKLTTIDRIPSSKIALFLMALRFTLLQRDRSLVLVTEGLGPQPFHGRVVILTNEFTHSAAEMVASFARENHLATLVGNTTSGEVLGGANFKLVGGYRLRMPVAGWYTWSGECIEGKGIPPEVPVEVQPESLASGIDNQLNKAIDVAQAL